MREFIKVVTGGQPREMGIDIGRATADIIRDLVAANPSFYQKQTGRSMAFIRRFAMRNYLPPARRFYPDYVSEIEGIAEGAGQRFEDVMVFSAEEEMLDIWTRWDRCSSASVRTRRGIYLLHNEDYVPRYRNRLVLIEGRPDGAPGFLSLSYPGTLAGSACGINTAGLAMSGNSLTFRPRRRGITKNFSLRDILAARTLNEAEQRFAVPDRAIGNSLNVVSAGEDGSFYIEATVLETARVDLAESDLLTHTNHVISPSIDRHGERASWNSRLRLAGLEFLLNRRRDRSTLQDLKEALSSKSHFLLRRGRQADDPETLASTVMDPRRGIMYVANRASSDGKYVEYELKKKRR